jgi:hypothetical protein
MTKIRIPMDVHNTFRECGVGEESYPRNTNPLVHPFMRPLIEALSVKRPEWKFVVPDNTYGTATDHTSTQYTFNRFRVFADDEDIGLIDYEANWRDSSKSYIFDCRGLRAKRERGSFNKAKDLKKAVRIILDNFTQKSFIEHAGEARREAENQSMKAVTALNYEIERAINTRSVRNVLMAFIEQRWEELAPLIDPSYHERMLRAVEQSYQYAEAAAIRDHPKRLAVRIVGKHYVTVPADSTAQPDVYTYTSDNLPDSLRGAIGALKLVPEKSVVGDIGMRVDETTFLVIPASTGEE